MNAEWGYIPNLHISLDGDTTRAGQYLPYGQNLVRSLIRTGRYVAEKRLTLADGTQIAARIAGDQRWLNIRAVGGCSLWLETGFVYLLPMAGPDRYTPSRVYFGPFDMQAHLYGAMNAQSGTADKTTRPLSGDYSPKSFFFKPQDEKTQQWPVSESLVSKKQFIGKVPASLFSGKLRLFVQARYGGALMNSMDGTPLFDWVPKQVLGAAPYIEVPDVTTIDSGCGLYTADDGTYWLIAMSSPVMVNQVKLTECGKAVMRTLAQLERAGPLPRAKRSEYEAYALSDATIDKQMKFTLQNIPAAAPIAYSWKFNWDGSKASCISVATLGSGNNTYWSTSRQDVTFFRDSKKDVSQITDPIQAERTRWTMGSSSVATGDFSIQWGYASVWTPLWMNMTQFRKSGSNGFIVAKPGSGPIYGWYDDEDKFVTVNYTLTAKGSTTSTDTEPHGCPPCGILNIGLDASRETATRTVNYSAIFTLPNGVTGRIDNWSESYFKEHEVIENRWYDGPRSWPGNSPQPPNSNVSWGGFSNGDQGYSGKGTHGDCNPYWDVVLEQNHQAYLQAVAAGYGNAGHVTQNRSRIRTEETGNRSQGGLLAVVIPFYECEGAYLFDRQTQNETPSKLDTWNSGVAVGSHLIQDATTSYAVADYFPLESYRLVGLVTTVPAPTVSIDTTVGHYSVKSQSGTAAVDSLSAIMSPDNIHDESLKQCVTMASAVTGQITGKDIDPSHADFQWTEGNFIGWI
jgi:hypothetical protein